MLPTLASALVTLAAAAIGGGVPSAALTPADVVRAQLAALATNDPATDDGVRRTFLFASPQNRQVTGPAERFVTLVKNPAYAPLVGARQASLLDARRDGDAYEALVEVVAADGTKRRFVFQLGLQGDGPFKGCWMTEGVAPLQPQPPAGGGGMI